MSFAPLPEGQAGRARQPFDSPTAAADHDLRAIAELRATEPDGQLSGATESQPRDPVLRLGAKALQAAAARRKRGGPSAPA